MVPGKIGSSVVLGFRSADNNAFYDVELLREKGAAVGAQVQGYLAQKKHPPPRPLQ